MPAEAKNDHEQQRDPGNQLVLWLDIIVRRDIICSDSQAGLVYRLCREVLKGGLASMSNEKETNRPLDTEKLNGTQMEGITGGSDESGSEKVRFNTAYINISDRDR